MEMLATVTWPTAFAVVGSIVTIVIGLFGYLRGKDSGKTAPTSPVETLRGEINELRTAITSGREENLITKSEFAVLRSHVDTLQRQLADHERRDIDDFRAVNAKIDKIMDIIVQILQDDKL